MGLGGAPVYIDDIGHALKREERYSDGKVNLDQSPHVGVEKNIVETGKVVGEKIEVLEKTEHSEIDGQRSGERGKGSALVFRCMAMNVATAEVIHGDGHQEYQDVGFFPPCIEKY